MEKQFFILIGRSGSGKGTQADLLKTYLEGKDHTKVQHFTTGGNFREFIARSGYVSSLSKKVNDEGALQPEFLAVWNWSSIFINQLQGEETIILDGAPRKAFEVAILHSAISFMGYTKPTVVYIDVSESWAIDKLQSRGREDDANMDEIRKKMDWFDTDVMQALALYKEDPRYRVLHINGEQTIEEVHNELVAKLEATQ